MPTLPATEAQDGLFWASFFEREHPRLIAVAMTWLGRLEDARDIVQEVLIRIVERAERIEMPMAYCSRAIRNAAIDRIRNRKRQPNFVPLASGSECLIDAAAAAAIGRLEDAEFVRQALVALSPEQREVIVLKIYAELTFAEVATALNIPQGTAATHYRRGIDSLRDRFAEDCKHDT